MLHLFRVTAKVFTFRKGKGKKARWGAPSKMKTVSKRVWARNGAHAKKKAKLVSTRKKYFRKVVRHAKANQLLSYRKG